MPANPICDSQKKYLRNRLELSFLADSKAEAAEKSEQLREALELLEAYE